MGFQVDDKGAAVSRACRFSAVATCDRCGAAAEFSRSGAADEQGAIRLACSRMERVGQRERWQAGEETKGGQRSWRAYCPQCQGPTVQCRLVRGKSPNFLELVPPADRVYDRGLRDYLASVGLGYDGDLPAFITGQMADSALAGKPVRVDVPERYFTARGCTVH